MDAIRAKTRAVCKAIYAQIVKGSPPEPCEQVQELFKALELPKRPQLMMYEVFHELRQAETEDIVKTAVHIEFTSVIELVTERRRWVGNLLDALLTIGGCEEENVTWDQFLYILLQFCSLSKVELTQTLFLMISTNLESKVHHYLTLQQLTEFYSFYGKCPVTSFNTRAIDFTKLPLRRYYVEDFSELVQRFTVLLNPTIHLQRSLQEFMPSVDFWDNFHRSEVVIRKITRDFFHMEKSRCFLWGEPPFRESADMLAPEALGFEACNKDQWDLRTFDLHERVGALSEQGSFSRDGKLLAPPGYQYRSLRQFSIWGEQPNPEEVEEMMFAEKGETYMTEQGYLAKAHQDMDVDPDAKDTDKKKKKRDKKKAALAMRADELDPLRDPQNLCLRAACIDEEFNPPPKDMPPTWMKVAAICPAPRIPGPDRPLRAQQAPGPNTMSAFWNSTISFGNDGQQIGQTGMGQTGMSQMNSTGMSFGGPGSPTGMDSFKGGAKGGGKGGGKAGPALPKGGGKGGPTGMNLSGEPSGMNLSGGPPANSFGRSAMNDSGGPAGARKSQVKFSN